MDLVTEEIVAWFHEVVVRAHWARAGAYGIHICWEMGKSSAAYKMRKCQFVYNQLLLLELSTSWEMI
jgi:hypothetical protein